MARDTLENDRSYFCREETTGRGFCGMFHIDDNEMVARLFSFEEYLPGQLDDFLVIRLEDDSIVSLHNNISGGLSSRTSSETKLSSWSRRIISNVVVVGDDAWHPSDPVRRVQFSIAHSEDLLHHIGKFDAIADSEFGMGPDTTLFELVLDGLKIKVWYPSSGTPEFKRPTQIGVSYGIEFDEPRDLFSYLKDVQSVVQFISAALGYRAAPFNISISRLSHAEFLAAVEARKGYGDHQVRYIWPIDTPDDALWVGRAFVFVRDDKELADFVVCLKQWVERDAEWRNATSLLMSALGLQSTMSGERLLNACNWLEEIPGAASEVAVSEEDINAIALAAAAEAQTRGHAGYAPRIAGVIRGQLKTESNAERFDRLCQAVSDRFGEKALKTDIGQQLLKAMQYRGRVAHGHFEPMDDADFEAFARAIYSLEALCYLLTIKDLHMSDEGAKRSLGQRIVARHRLHLG